MRPGRIRNETTWTALLTFTIADYQQCNGNANVLAGFDDLLSARLSCCIKSECDDKNCHAKGPTGCSGLNHFEVRSPHNCVASRASSFRTSVRSFPFHSSLSAISRRKRLSAKMCEVIVLFDGFSRTLEDGNMHADCTCTLIKGPKLIIVDTMTAWGGKKLIEGANKQDGIFITLCTYICLLTLRLQPTILHPPSATIGSFKSRVDFFIVLQ